MSRPVIVGFGVLAFLAILAWRVNEARRPQEIPFEAKVQPSAAAPLCPWRDPPRDLASFFPDATRREVETRILSGLRVELAERLGRAPKPEEHALQLFRIYHEQTPLGVVMTGRAKGEYGAIEFVLAVDPDGQVRGLRLQRLREPPVIATALESGAWLSRFQGRTHRHGWQTDDPSELPEEARPSGQAIREAVRSLLVLLSASEGAGVPSSTKPHH